MKTTTWEYIGDVNPFEHGGTWFRQEEGSESTFEFITVQEAQDEYVLIARGNIDLEDSWIDKNSVESYSEVNYGNNVETAHAVLSYYGYYEFDQDPNYENSEGKLKAYLKWNGIEF